MKNQIIDFDFEFEDVEFDEAAINRATGALKAVSAREQNGWREKNELRYQDKDYKEKWKASIKEAYENPELRKRHSELHIGVSKSEEHKENIRKARLNAPPRSKDTRKKIGDAQRGNTKHCKPMVTPLGIFASLGEAGAAHEKQEGLGNANNQIRKRINENWDGYYRITKEEYTLLTGKEL